MQRTLTNRPRAAFMVWYLTHAPKLNPQEVRCSTDATQRKSDEWGKCLLDGGLIHATRFRGRPISLRVTLRIAAVPIPGGGDDLVEFRETGQPAQLAPRLVGGGDQTRRIARAARLLDGRNLSA